MRILLKAILVSILLLLILTTGTIGLTKDPVGLIFCCIFIALEVLLVSLFSSEANADFRSSLVLINSLDLTFKADLRRNNLGRRPTVRDTLIAQGSWLHRHGFSDFR